jgi:hypothetical protein
MVPEENKSQDIKFKSSKLTKAACISPFKGAVTTEVFVWPPESKTAEYMAQGVYLNGVENDKKNGTGRCFNWIMSNGDNSE